MIRSRILLVRCCVVVAAISIATGCSAGLTGAPAATSTPTATPNATQAVPRLVVVTGDKEFVRTPQTPHGLFTLKPLPADEKVALTFGAVWAALAGKDPYIAEGSVAYLGMYSEPALKVSNAVYVVVGGPLPIPRCQGGAPASVPAASPGGPPVGNPVTLCYRIVVVDGTTGDILHIIGADIPD